MIYQTSSVYVGIEYRVPKHHRYLPVDFCDIVISCFGGSIQRSSLHLQTEIDPMPRGETKLHP